MQRKEEIYIPTHRDETAMDRAPEQLWLVEGGQKVEITEVVVAG